MGKLVTCASCGGFRRGLACPHCGKVARAIVGAAAVLGSGALAFTLMACYGVAPCPEGNKDCRSPSPSTDAGRDMTMPKASDSQDSPTAK
ncbi:MAG TPA: hypothetical protein VIF62_26570 [Labilithrix sp.]|jgi:hypothetical protein